MQQDTPKTGTFAVMRGWTAFTLLGVLIALLGAVFVQLITNR